MQEDKSILDKFQLDHTSYAVEDLYALRINAGQGIDLMVDSGNLLIGKLTSGTG